MSPYGYLQTYRVVVLDLNIIVWIFANVSCCSSCPEYHRMDICKRDFSSTVQSNLVNTDTEGTIESVRINEMSVLSGCP